MSVFTEISRFIFSRPHPITVWYVVLHSEKNKEECLIVVHSQHIVPNMFFCSWDLLETFWWVKKNLVTHSWNRLFSVYKLTILAHKCKIKSYCYDIKLILSKIHHFRIFQFFSPKWPYKIFENNINRLNLTLAFEWCINYYIWMSKNFGQFLAYWTP